jgi:hypothetical protein
MATRAPGNVDRVLQRGAPPVEPTFTHELEALAVGHVALWLADLVPAGPILLWACPRDLAVALAQGRRNEVVLLEPREREAAEGIRRGAAGLRVVHTPLAGGRPDTSDLGLIGFTAVVASLQPDGDVDGVLGALLALAAEDSALVVLAPLGASAEVVEALDRLGRDGSVVEHRIAACSFISGADTDTARIERVGADHGRRAAPELVVSGLPGGHPEASVCIGAEQGLRAWLDGVDELAATVTALDDIVTTAHRDRVAELEAQVTDREARLRGAEEALALLHRSTSWRITRPIRVLRDALGHR